jgi:DNA-binding transcriptional LysR family regulator
MELSDLRVFRAVVHAGGVTRAADRLHRVPSSVTTRVKNLEEELGIALFLREGKRMQLSPAGKILLEYADRLLALSEEVRDALHDTQPRGILHLGSMESTAAVRLPEPLSRFHERYPAVSLELSIGDPRHLTAQVLAGALDAALVAEPVSDPALEKVVVYEEQLVIVAQAGHPPIASPKDVKKRTLLAFHPGCPHRNRLEDWFARSGVSPERVVELVSYHAILGCAVAGMGVAVMPRSVLDTYAYRSRLSIHQLDAKLRSLRTLLVWRRNAPQAKIAAFAEFLAPKRAETRTGSTRVRRSKQGS